MMQCEYGYDPAYIKLKAVKEDADSLGLPVSITKGLQSVIDLYQVSAQVLHEICA